MKYAIEGHQGAFAEFGEGESHSFCVRKWRDKIENATLFDSIEELLTAVGKRAKITAYTDGLWAIVVVEEELVTQYTISACLK